MFQFIKHTSKNQPKARESFVFAVIFCCCCSKWQITRIFSKFLDLELQSSNAVTLRSWLRNPSFNLRAVLLTLKRYKPKGCGEATCQKCLPSPGWGWGFTGDFRSFALSLSIKFLLCPIYSSFRNTWGCASSCQSRCLKHGIINCPLITTGDQAGLFESNECNIEKIMLHTMILPEAISSVTST